MRKRESKAVFGTTEVSKYGLGILRKGVSKTGKQLVKKLAAIRSPPPTGLI